MLVHYSEGSKTNQPHHTYIPLNTATCVCLQPNNMMLLVSAFSGIMGDSSILIDKIEEEFTICVICQDEDRQELRLFPECQHYFCTTCVGECMID